MSNIDISDLYDNSFLNIAEYLKNDCNIKNYDFMLKIYNTALNNIDPHDPNLSNEMKDLVKIECTDNIWYFLRNVVRIPMQGGGYSKFKLNKQNCAQIFCYTLGVNSWSTTPNYLKREINTICIELWHTLFNPGFVGCFARNRKHSKDILHRFDSIIGGLPDYLKPRKSIVHLNEVKISNGNIDDLQYRLESLNRLIHFSEAEFIPCIDDIYNSLDKDIRLIFESSCNSDYDITGAKNILDNSLEWDESYYDYDISNHNLIHIKYEYRDFFENVHESEKWYNKKVEELPVSAVVTDILLERPFYKKEVLRQRAEKRNKDSVISHYNILCSI